MKAALALLLAVLISQSVQATLAPRMHSIMTQMSGSLNESTDINGSATYNNKLSLEVLYLIRSGPTFGARYMIESRNENSAQAGQAYGPIAGYYFENGIFILINYDIFAKLGKWSNGEGAEASVGYLEHIGNQIHVGAKYSLRRIRYKTDITDNTAVLKTVNDQFPSLTLMYLF